MTASSLEIALATVGSALDAGSIAGSASDICAAALVAASIAGKSASGISTPRTARELTTQIAVSAVARRARAPPPPPPPHHCMSEPGMIGHAPSTAEERNEALVVDVADGDRRDSDVTDLARLLKRRAIAPPLALILIIGALPTPVVFGGMIGASSVFLALFGVEAGWFSAARSAVGVAGSAARVRRLGARVPQARAAGARPGAVGDDRWRRGALFYVFGRRTGD